MTITIRHAEPDDFEAVQKVYAGPKAIHGTLQLPYPSLELWRQRLANPPEHMRSLVAIRDNEIVGQLGLQTNSLPRRSHTAFLGMAVRDDAHRQGIGSALMAAAIDLADSWLNVLRLELTVFTDNAAAIGLYRKFGFEIEGTHRMYALRAGQLVDVYEMARLHPHPPVMRYQSRDAT